MSEFRGSEKDKNFVAPVDKDTYIEDFIQIAEGEKMAEDKDLFPDLNLPDNERRDSKAEIIEFRSMLAKFEFDHPLELLMGITDLKAEDAPSHPIREPARKDYVILKEKLTNLSRETNISGEDESKFDAHLKRVWRSIGTFRWGKIVHD